MYRSIFRSPSRIMPTGHSATLKNPALTHKTCYSCNNSSSYSLVHPSLRYPHLQPSLKSSHSTLFYTLSNPPLVRPYLFSLIILLQPSSFSLALAHIIQFFYILLSLSYFSHSLSTFFCISTVQNLHNHLFTLFFTAFNPHSVLYTFQTSLIISVLSLFSLSTLQNPHLVFSNTSQT